MDLLLILLVVALGVAIIFGAVILVLRRLAGRAQETLRATTGDRPAVLQEHVNTLGRASRGKGQVRGNGTLGLFEDELVFVQWAPSRTDRISREAITKVDTPRAFLGKTYGRRLLAVTWRTPEGGEDRMAWVVKDLDEWLTALGEAPPPAGDQPDAGPSVR